MQRGVFVQNEARSVTVNCHIFEGEGRGEAGGNSVKNVLARF